MSGLSDIGSLYFCKGEVVVNIPSICIVLGTYEWRGVRYVKIDFAGEHLLLQCWQWAGQKYAIELAVPGPGSGK
jgi:hypothetical protein